MKRLILLGGGHAHVHVLKDFAREAPAGAEVTLVSPYARQIYSGMLPGIVAGHYRAEQAAIALVPLATAARAHFVQSAAVALEAPARRLRLADGRTIGYDVLSIDAGSVMERQRIPGAAQHALFVRPIEAFLLQFEALLDRAARQELDVVVLGGGAAGVELALALQRRLGGSFGGSGGSGGRGRSADLQARVALVLGGTQLLAGYLPAVVQHAERALARARVTLFREPCTEVRERAVVLASGARVACDVAVVVTGAEAPAWLAGSGLALDGHGFIVTGPTLQSGSHPEVFAAGDIATRIDEPHAKSGVYAVRAGPPLTRNLRAFVAGAPLARYVPPQRTLNLLSAGERRAIVAWGGFSAAGRWAWWWKDSIDRGFVARYRADSGGAAGVIPSAEMQ